MADYDGGGGGDKEATTTAPAVNSGGFRKVAGIVQMLHRWRRQSSAARRSSKPSISGETSSNAAAAAAAGDDDDDEKKPLLTPAAAAGKVVVVEERAEEAPVTPMTPEEGQIAAADVPRGCCAVYVGAAAEEGSRRRFVVPTAYLGMPVFRRLLEKAEEEFGFEYSDGALTIPCDTEDFKYILGVMDCHRKGLLDDEGNPKEDAAGEGSSEKRE
uniref:Uncharacterized protein n=1 Tax=Leersia perrieri TaxID=77586 RepID=A0A0D9WMW3_9ORYZ